LISNKFSKYSLIDLVEVDVLLTFVEIVSFKISFLSPPPARPLFSETSDFTGVFDPFFIVLVGIYFLVLFVMF